MTRTLLRSLFLIVICCFSLSCDTGLGLMTTKITGKIIFLNTDKKPDYVEAVQVIAATKSLFVNPTLSDVVIADRPVNLSKPEPDYEVFVPPDTYTVVAAIWKEKGKDWNFLNILGFYGFDPVNFTYYDKDPIVITKDGPVASGYDIICDWGFAFPASGARVAGQTPPQTFTTPGSILP